MVSKIYEDEDRIPTHELGGMISCIYIQAGRGIWVKKRPWVLRSQGTIPQNLVQNGWLLRTNMRRWTGDVVGP